MRFRQFIIEAETPKKKPTSSAKKQEVQDKHVAFTFGRFNPPHAGHGKMMDAVKSYGGDTGNYRIYPSRTQDNKKNPLSADQKIKHMRAMFKDHKDKIQNSEAHRNIFDIMKDLNDEGHEHVTMVVGDDRVKEFDKLTKKYNGVHYDFKSINVKSAGKRDPKSDDPLEALSASSLRKHATSGDHEAFHAGTGGYKNSKQMMADVQAGLTPKQKAEKAAKKAKAKLSTATGTKEKTVKETWEYAPKLALEEFREHYIQGELFDTGTLIEHDNTGIRGHIVHRGTNHVIFKDEYGDEFKAWLGDITEIAMKTDKKVPLGRKSNPYGKRAVLKMLIKSVAERERSRAGVAKESTDPNRKDQSNYSADDGSGNDWKVGTDKYRQAVQSMTPGQGVIKFSEFRKTVKTK
tara:strand:+ start:3505 stop:4716 length:1212 start_codon:yes stop_codon:yes gene_type:complete